MTLSTVLGYLAESSFIIGVFIVGLAFAIWQGRQSLINVICANYLALLFLVTLPLSESVQSNSLIVLTIFLTAAVLSFAFFHRVMPPPYLEGKLESFGKKILLASAFTIMLLILILNYLPLTSLINQQLELLSFIKDSTYAGVYLGVPLILVALN